MATFGIALTMAMAAFALVILVLAIADHPRLLSGYRQQTIVVDVAHRNEAVLRSHLEMMLGGQVVNLSVVRLDLVNDTTVVDVRYRVPRTPEPNESALKESALKESAPAARTHEVVR